MRPILWTVYEREKGCWRRGPGDGRGRRRRKKKYLISLFIFLFGEYIHFSLYAESLSPPSCLCTLDMFIRNEILFSSVFQYIQIIARSAYRVLHTQPLPSLQGPLRNGGGRGRGG
jgi:hypothetical protein